MAAWAVNDNVHAKILISYKNDQKKLIWVERIHCGKEQRSWKRKIAYPRDANEFESILLKKISRNDANQPRWEPYMRGTVGQCPFFISTRKEKWMWNKKISENSKLEY